MCLKMVIMIMDRKVTILTLIEVMEHTKNRAGDECLHVVERCKNGRATTRIDDGCGKDCN